MKKQKINENWPVLETELEIIQKYIKYAEQSYQDNKTPEEGNTEKLSKELYDKLFGWRDSQPERPLQRPVEYNLIEIFKELKFGRPAADQKFLDKCIDELNKESLHIKNDLPQSWYDWHDAKKEKPCPAQGFKSISPKVEVRTPLGEGTGYFNSTDNDWLIELYGDVTVPPYGDVTDELQGYKDVAHWRFIKD